MPVKELSLCLTLWLTLTFAQSIESYGGYYLPTLVQENLEFCETETFTTECPEHHAVLITRAQYGRMEYGKCIKPGYRHEWCGEDVLLQLENICSGKRNCEIRIPDKLLESKAECPPDLKTYLNVSYRCVEVEHDACFKCRKGEFALVKYQAGYLASFTSLNSLESSQKKQCGTVTCPWKIEVMAGQTINITLLDFTLEKTSFAKGNCFRFAVIKEKPYTKDTGVCGGRNREHLVYHSVSNSVELHVINPKVFSSFGQFILKYEAVGCADLETLPNAKVKRDKDVSEVMCSDGQQWRLKCEGKKWVGEHGVCPSALIEMSSARYIGSLSVGLLTAIVIGIALVIAVLIVTIGVVCLKKHHQDSLRSRGALYVHPSQCYELRGGYQRSTYADEDSLMRKYQKSLYPYSTQSVRGVDRKNVYDVPKSIESRPLPSIPVDPPPVPKIKQIEAQMELKSHKYQSVIVSTSASTAYEPTISSSTFAYQSQLPAAPSSSGKYPSSHYTVLDSAAQQQQHQSTSKQTNASAASLETGALTWAVPDPQSTTYSYASSSQGGSDDGVSSKESGAQGGSKARPNVMAAGAFQTEVYNSEIPLRPMREGSQAAVNNCNINNAVVNNNNNNNNSNNINKAADQSERASTDKSFSTGTNSWP